MALQLFNGSDSENDEISKVKINEEYARRFEHNKRREDLQRLEELKKKGLISSSSSSSSDGDEDSESSDYDDGYEDLIGSRRRDKEFFDALIKVKKQDPRLKENDIKLFESDHSSEEESNEREIGHSKDKKVKNPMYLKDVMAKHLIEEGPDFGDKEEERNEKEKGKAKNKKSNKTMQSKDVTANHLIEEGSDFVEKDGINTYVDEQEELKRSFLEAAEREDLEDREGDFFVVKEKESEDKRESDDKEFEKKLDEYFGEDNENENFKFLKSYFMNKMWIDKNRETLDVDEDELVGISEDEREIERQEEYEYRFQENQGDRVLGHARKVEGSVRKKTNARKEQRKSKEERMAIAQKEREEELKHLKNLKKQEIQEKVKKIMKTAGIHDDDIIPLSAAEIEEEFDPEEYDKMMKKAFDEKYYNAEDADSDFFGDNDDEMEKPDFEKEDELLGLPKDWDVCGSDDGFLAARDRALKQKMENSSDHDLQEKEENNEEQVPEEGKRKRKRKTALLERARQAMMDEYYKLDYEDTIGDLKTRFKYAKTKPNRYGLSPAELLMVDEKELNQYISLKKLAPYREEEWKLSKGMRYQLKKKSKELLHSGSWDSKKKDKRSKVDATESTSSNILVDNDKALTEEPNVEMKSLSRKARRKQNVAHLKLSDSRLKSYRQIPSKSKGKKKH